MRATTYQKYLLLLGCLCISAVAHARVHHPFTSCNNADVHLTYVGTDAGAGQQTAYYALKNTSKKTCVIHGYTAQTVVSSYIDNALKPIQDKKIQNQTAKVKGPSYTLRPHETAYFSTNSGAPNGDVNEVVKEVVFYFDGIRGHLSIGCANWNAPQMSAGQPNNICDKGGYTTYQGFSFNSLTKEKPNL